MFVVDREHASVASESCRIFHSDRSVHLRTQQCGNAEKPRLQDVKRTDFIRYWRRSGFKNPDKLKIFIKKNVRNHSYHQIYPVLAKIRINRGLLYIELTPIKNWGFLEKMVDSFAYRVFFIWICSVYSCTFNSADKPKHGLNGTYCT